MLAGTKMVPLIIQVGRPTGEALRRRVGRTSKEGAAGGGAGREQEEELGGGRHEACSRPRTSQRAHPITNWTNLLYPGKILLLWGIKYHAVCMHVVPSRCDPESCVGVRRKECGRGVHFECGRPGSTPLSTQIRHAGGDGRDQGHRARS